MYVCMYVCICVHIYIYIYIYGINREPIFVADDTSNNLLESFSLETRAKSGIYVPHHCGPGCCQNRAESVTKLTKAVLLAMLPSVPSAPVVTKWTKLGPCLDFFLVAGIHATLGKLFNAVAAGFSCLQGLPPAATTDGGDGGDEGQPEKLNWHRLPGERLARSQQLTMHWEKHMLAMLCIFVEPLRHLHLYFLKLAHSQVNYDKRPRVMDEISPAHSIVHQTLQYYSSLLAGHSSCLALLWPLCRCQSFGELLSESLMLARRYKSGLLCIAGWLQRRVWLMMAGWPWLLYGLADDRRMLEREPLLDKFFSTGACCKPAGLSRDLQEGGASKLELLGAPMRDFLLACAQVAETSIACLDKHHAVDRRLSHLRMPWHVSAALSCNAHRREYVTPRRPHAQLQSAPS